MPNRFDDDDDDNDLSYMAAFVVGIVLFAALLVLGWWAVTYGGSEL